MSAQRICYVLLSPTWGMHQYTADLANRRQAAGAEVHVVTTRRAPRERYAPGVALHQPVDTRDTGFSPGGLRGGELRRAARALGDLGCDVAHFGGPHLWNPLLMQALRRAGVAAVHTLHDLHPHRGAAYGRLLYAWNGWVRRRADRLLVHGERYRDELLGKGVRPGRVTCTRLTHLFVSYALERELREGPLDVQYEPWALTIGRLERYKGLDVLAEAAQRLDPRVRVVVAGPGRAERTLPERLPENLEVRNRLVGDAEAVELFRRCGVVVLPYVEASQSALVAAAYFFRKPAIVTDVGALPEYVQEGVTGWVVPGGDAPALAGALEEALAGGGAARLAQMGESGRMWYEEQRRAEDTALGELYAT